PLICSVRRRGLRGRGRIDRKGEQDGFWCLLEFLGDGRAGEGGKLAQRLVLVQLGEADGHRRQPSVVPAETDIRLHAGRLRNVSLDGLGMFKSLGHGVDRIAPGKRCRQNDSGNGLLHVHSRSVLTSAGLRVFRPSKPACYFQLKPDRPALSISPVAKWTGRSSRGARACGKESRNGNPTE